MGHRIIDSKGSQPSVLEEQIQSAKVDTAKALTLSGLHTNLAIFHDNFGHTAKRSDGTEGYCSSVMIVKTIGIEVAISGKGSERNVAAFPVIEASCEKCQKTAVFKIIKGRWDITMFH